MSLVPFDATRTNYPDMIEVHRAIERQYQRRLEALDKEMIPVIDLMRRAIRWTLNNNASRSSSRWGHNDWAGPYVSSELPPDKGFDYLTPLYEMATEHFRKLESLGYAVKSRRTILEPEPEDYAEIMRRAWTWKIGNVRFTIMGFADLNSELCKRVQVGVEPKYELHCPGSPIPGLEVS